MSKLKFKLPKISHRYLIGIPLAAWNIGYAIGDVVTHKVNVLTYVGFVAGSLLGICLIARAICGE
jgi:hypothetical protein